MFEAYCNNCGQNWENSSPNCPHCGTPNHSAERVSAEEPTRRTRKKVTMPEKGTTSAFTKSLAESVKQGALMATANEANTLIKSGVVKGLAAAGVPEEALEGAIFQKGLPLMSATVILFLAERFPDMIPKSDSVARAAQLALTQASADTIEPLLQAAAPTLMALASAGDKAKELEGDVYTDEEVEPEVHAASGEEYEEGEFSERPIDVTPQGSDNRREGPRSAPAARPARSRD